MNARHYFLDRVRVWSVYAVVLLHVGMNYMVGAPNWWYVQDEQRSTFFLLLVLVMDIFPMSALFFVAGFCTPASWNKKGAVGFLKGKVWRIAIPWVVGVGFVAPFFAAASLHALGYPIGDFFKFYTTVFLGPAYQQAHYWFLGILFAFYILYALVAPFFRTQEEGAFSWAPIFACWGISTVLYALVGYRQPDIDSWFNLGFVLYFQSLRIGGYATIFLLGAYMWKSKAFAHFPSHKQTILTGILSALLLALTVFLRLKWGGTLSGHSLWVYAAVHQATAISTTFALLLGCRLWGDEQSSLMDITSKASYGLYWSHMIIMVPIAMLLTTLSWPAWIKFTLVLLLTLQIGERGTLIVLEKIDKKNRDANLTIDKG